MLLVVIYVLVVLGFGVYLTWNHVTIKRQERKQQEVLKKYFNLLIDQCEEKCEKRWEKQPK
jgi:hypothetical protein